MSPVTSSYGVCPLRSYIACAVLKLDLGYPDAQNYPTISFLLWFVQKICITFFLFSQIADLARFCHAWTVEFGQGWFLDCSTLCSYFLPSFLKMLWYVIHFCLHRQMRQHLVLRIAELCVVAALVVAFLLFLIFLAFATNLCNKICEGFSKECYRHGLLAHGLLAHIVVDVVLVVIHHAVRAS